MISIGGFDYTVNEAAMIYLVESNRDKPSHSLAPSELTCLMGFTKRFLKSHKGTRFDTYDDFLQATDTHLKFAISMSTTINDKPKRQASKKKVHCAC